MVAVLVPLLCLPRILTASRHPNICREQYSSTINNARYWGARMESSLSLTPILSESFYSSFPLEYNKGHYNDNGPFFVESHNHYHFVISDPNASLF